MVSLYADRFLRFDSGRDIDSATGESLTLRIREAGTRPAQEAWTVECAGALTAASARPLIDFGFVGQSERFEAYRRTARRRYSEVDLNSLRTAVARAIEWLERSRLPPNILYVSIAQRLEAEWMEMFAREARQCGFTPVGVFLLDRRLRCSRLPSIVPLLTGRSLVLVDNRRASRSGSSLARGLIRLLTIETRLVSAAVIVNGGPAHSIRPVAQAAEGRAAYGATSEVSYPRRNLGMSIDSRAAGLLREAEGCINRGRHVAAERTLRAAAAAFERRRDLLRAGNAHVRLGRLLLVRGRPAAAQGEFTRARDAYQRLGAQSPAVNACVLAGVAETDEALLDRADTTLRAAHAAAAALQDDDLVRTAAVALARNLRWQKRGVEALALLQPLASGAGPEYWALMTKLRLDRGELTEASRCVARARKACTGHELQSEAAVRLAQACLQARLGDVEALRFHVGNGIVEARAAHLPLHTIRLRLTLMEGLFDAGVASGRGVIRRCVERYSRTVLPELLKQRIGRLMHRLNGSGGEDHRNVGTAHESAPIFELEHSEAIPELLSVCQGAEDERAALNAAARVVHKCTDSAGVGIFAAERSIPTLLTKTGAVTEAIARRCLEAVQPILPERTGSGVETAVPIPHLGRTIGVIVCRWIIEPPADTARTIGFVRIAAAACAPLIQIVLERHPSVPPETTPGGIEILGVSPAMDEVRRQIARAANAPFSVLIEGESGSGKELVARAIHRSGCRRERALCALNCAALTEELIDAELFGHAKGAFTGALFERLGLFESAEGGSVFLDEVGELSVRGQAKLLRVLQEGEIRRIGESFARPVDARLISATNKPLQAEAEAGRFRRDLIYRLDVIRIAVPPLRERVEDVPLLATRFWRTATDRIGSKAILGSAALATLARYDWPGNVRELQNVLAALAVAVPPRGVVSASAMPAAIAHAARTMPHETLNAARRRFEQRFVRAALARTSGHRGQAATALGVSRQGLSKLMQRLELP